MLKGYKEYKKTLSHFDRIIPKHWVEQRLSVACKPKSIINNNNDELLSVFLNYGVIKYKSTSQKQVHKPSEDLSKYQLVEIGDLVLNNQQAWRGSVGVSSYRGIVSPAYYVYKISPEYNSSFFNYMVRDRDVVDQFVLFSKGVGSIQRMLNNSLIKNVIFTLPPRHEQDQIVRYLDWKVSMINKYINAKKKQVELLKEHKQAIINQAVTKGLDMNVPMKDSGIEWLGKIPVHWEEKSIRSITKLSDKRRGNRKDLELLSVYREYGVIKKDSRDDNRNVESEDLTNYKHVKKGNLVLNKMKMWQGSLGISDYEGIVSPAYIVCNLFTDANLTFLQFLLRSPTLKTFYNQVSYGIRVGQWDMHYEDFKSLRLFIPPRFEQDKIVRYLEIKISIINKYINENDNQIELLQEFRTRLISDVVTGKVNVQNVKVPEFIDDNQENQEIIEREDDEWSLSDFLCK